MFFISYFLFVLIVLITKIRGEFDYTELMIQLFIYSAAFAPGWTSHNLNPNWSSSFLAPIFDRLFKPFLAPTFFLELERELWFFNVFIGGKARVYKL